MNIYSNRYFLAPKLERGDSSKRYYLFGVNAEGKVRFATFCMDYQLCNKSVFVDIKDSYLGEEVKQLQWYFTDESEQYAKWLELEEKKTDNVDVSVEEFGGLGNVKAIRYSFAV